MPTLNTIRWICWRRTFFERFEAKHTEQNGKIYYKVFLFDEPIRILLREYDIELQT